jgi:transposase
MASLAYVPLVTPPGVEAQVDFGYAGYFIDSKRQKKVKSWLFCMVLSYSRYSYYELVQSQDVKTFLKCHINAFNFSIGYNVYAFYDKLKEIKPHYYHRTIMGIFDLAKKYGNTVIDLSSKRANEFNPLSYLSISKKDM